MVNAVTVVKAFDLYLIYDYYGKRFQAVKKGYNSKRGDIIRLVVFIDRASWVI